MQIICQSYISFFVRAKITLIYPWAIKPEKEYDCLSLSRSCVVEDRYHQMVSCEIRRSCQWKSVDYHGKSFRCYRAQDSKPYWLQSRTLDLFIGLNLLHSRAASRMIISMKRTSTTFWLIWMLCSFEFADIRLMMLSSWQNIMIVLITASGLLRSYEGKTRKNILILPKLNNIICMILSWLKPKRQKGRVWLWKQKCK